jgi:nucleoside-diphosphate-sugar epimerase
VVHDPAYEYDVQERSPAVDKAERLLGYRAETPLSTILDEVIPWIEEQITVGQI